MKKTLNIFLTYLLITFNSFVFAVEKNNTNILKIGILAPFSGEFKFIGETILYSINLALHDINDESIKIYPKDSGSNKEEIFREHKKNNNYTLVFFESPKRLVKTLSVMKKIYPPTRRAVICREMTKIHEEFIRCKVKDVKKEDIYEKGELTIVISEIKENIKIKKALDISSGGTPACQLPRRGPTGTRGP